MCFAHDARPPEVPPELRRLAGSAPGERLELVSADGTRFSAYCAAPPDEGMAGVVVLPDVRGLYGFYEELTERFAGAGHAAIAIDPFGRTAGLGPRGEDFDHKPHVEQTTIEHVQADTAAACGVLRERAPDAPLAVVGFCLGGYHAFLAAAAPELALDGAVGFYGVLNGARYGVSPIDRAADMRCPILGLFGGDDAAIPVEQVRELERALDAAGADHDLHVYPGAPHSFFDRQQERFAAESQDAWRRTLSFLDTLSGRAGEP